MARPVRFLFSASLLALVSAGIGFVDNAARADESTDDNDELVAAPDIQGLPDKDTHSGRFLDILATGSSSIVGPAYFRIVVDDPADLRVFVFDGNTTGLWDQGNRENNPDGSPTSLGAVCDYTLVADGDGAPLIPFEPGAPPAFQPFLQVDSTAFFPAATDNRWKALFEGAHVPAALRAATGQHQYALRVRYSSPTSQHINGYKVAANGEIGQRPLNPVGDTLLGGFIGGVVDNRNLAFDFPSAPPNQNFSVSRDHYPDVLEPQTAGLNGFLNPGQATFAPAVRFPAPDPFVNGYTGVIEFGIRFEPGPGQSFEDFLSTLVFQEGDADNAGTNPANPIPNPGLPRDQGQAHLDSQGTPQNNSGYRLPVEFVPIGALPSFGGSPKLDLFDPNGVLQTHIEEMSGNVSQEDNTFNAFQDIPVPAPGGAGIWRVRISNLDARNTWFLRTNAETRPVTTSLEGCVWCDLGCDGGTMGGGDTPLPGVVVRLVGPQGFSRDVLTGDDGCWRAVNLPPGPYTVSVISGTPGGATPIGGTSKNFDLQYGEQGKNLDFPYCCDEECRCDDSGRVHEICFETRLWNPDPCAKRFDVSVRLEKGCCNGSLEDCASFSFRGPFPGEQRGRNGVIRVKEVKVDGCEVIVCVCLVADAPVFPAGYFDFCRRRIDVRVNCSDESLCTKIDCSLCKDHDPDTGNTGASDSSRCDEPAFRVKSCVPYNCWEKPCDDGCVRRRTYWKQVNRFGACDARRVPWPCPGAECKTLCGETWLEIVRRNPRGDTWTWLAQQWIVAQLNCCNGACVPTIVGGALREAEDLLEDHCCAFDRPKCERDDDDGDRDCEKDRDCKKDRDCDKSKGKDCDKAKDKDCDKSRDKNCDKSKERDCDRPKDKDCDKPPKDCGWGLVEERAATLAKILEQYNWGLIGPRKCEGDVPCCPPPPKDPCDKKPKCDDDRDCKKDRDCDKPPKDCDKPPKDCDKPPKDCDKPPKDCDKPPKDCDKPPKDCDKPPKDCDKPPKDCDKPKDKDCEKPPKCDPKPKGNNGVGNGIDGQPPGNPPINDGPGTSPGNPGNRKKGK